MAVWQRMKCRTCCTLCPCCFAGWLHHCSIVDLCPFIATAVHVSAHPPEAPLRNGLAQSYWLGRTYQVYLRELKEENSLCILDISRYQLGSTQQGSGCTAHAGRASFWVCGCPPAQTFRSRCCMSTSLCELQLHACASCKMYSQTQCLLKILLYIVSMSHADDLIQHAPATYVSRKTSQFSFCANHLSQHANVDNIQNGTLLYILGSCNRTQVSTSKQLAGVSECTRQADLLLGVKPGELTVCSM